MCTKEIRTPAKGRGLASSPVMEKAASSAISTDPRGTGQSREVEDLEKYFQIPRTIGILKATGMDHLSEKAVEIRYDFSGHLVCELDGPGECVHVKMFRYLMGPNLRDLAIRAVLREAEIIPSPHGRKWNMNMSNRAIRKFESLVPESVKARLRTLRRKITGRPA